MKRKIQHKKKTCWDAAKEVLQRKFTFVIVYSKKKTNVKQ